MNMFTKGQKFLNVLNRLTNSKMYRKIRMHIIKKGSFPKKTCKEYGSVTTYKWKNGNCVEISEGLTLHYDKNGWITETENGIGAPWTMTYDKNGHMLTYGAEDSYTEGFENIYKNGRLARQIQLDGNGKKYPENPPDAYTYKYKKIMVPSSVVKKVKSQQDWLTDKVGFQKLPLAAF